MQPTQMQDLSASYIKTLLSHNQELLAESNPNFDNERSHNHSKFQNESLLNQSNITFREGFKNVLRLSISSILMFICGFFNNLVNLYFLGNLPDTIYLAGGGLAISLMAIIMAFVGGLAITLETFCSQAFGNKQLRKCGEYHNQARAIVLVMMIPSLGIILLSKFFLTLINIDEKIVEIAYYYLLALFPTVLLMLEYRATRIMLQSMAMYKIPSIVTMITSITHLLQTYLIIHIFQFGYLGVALSAFITQALSIILLYGYIQFSGCCGEAWFCITLKSFKGWKEYFRLGLPTSLMICLEEWGYELLNLMAAYFGAEALSASIAYINIINFLIMMPLSYSFVGSTLVGNSIGEGNINNAKKYSKIILTIGLTNYLIIIIPILIFRHQLKYIFTQDEVVATILGHLIIIVIIHHLFDTLQIILAGIILGVGKQKNAAYLNFSAYYIFLQPAAYFLGFVMDWEVYGLWTACMCSVMIIFVFYLILVLRLNWRKVYEEAMSRLSV